MKKCELCGKTEYTTSIHKHHVIGRVGLNKDNPENLIKLCFECHWLWHNHRTIAMEDEVYRIMKTKYGNDFPVKVNGIPYKTKWIMRIEREQEDETINSR